MSYIYMNIHTYIINEKKKNIIKQNENIAHHVGGKIIADVVSLFIYMCHLSKRYTLKWVHFQFHVYIPTIFGALSKTIQCINELNSENQFSIFVLSNLKCLTDIDRKRKRHVTKQLNRFMMSSSANCNV